MTRGLTRISTRSTLTSRSWAPTTEPAAQPCCSSWRACWTRQALDNEVWLTFFDAEDRGNLDGWPFSVGASYMAENLTVTPQAVIVLDMVGDLDQQFYLERNSDPDLLADLWDVAADLGYQDQFIRQIKWSIIDDHAPFAALGLPAVDVIDFDYPAWHTSGDTLDQISAESLERIGRVMEVYLER